MGEFLLFSTLLNPAVKDHNRGRHLRVEECKKGEAYDKIGEVQRKACSGQKRVNKNAFNFSTQKESKANGTEIIIHESARIKTANKL